MKHSVVTVVKSDKARRVITDFSRWFWLALNWILKMESFAFLVPFDPLHWTLICLQPLYSSHENLIKSSWHGDGRTYPFSSWNLDKLLLSSNLFFLFLFLFFFLNLGLIRFAAVFYFTCHRVHSFIRSIHVKCKKKVPISQMSSWLSRISFLTLLLLRQQFEHF